MWRPSWQQAALVQEEAEKSLSVFWQDAMPTERFQQGNNRTDLQFLKIILLIVVLVPQIYMYDMYTPVLVPTHAHTHIHMSTCKTGEMDSVHCTGVYFLFAYVTIGGN